MALRTTRVFQWLKGNRYTLDGSNASLKFVPLEEIARFPQLSVIRFMDLSYNYLEVLPDAFAPVLLQLEKLSLSSNSIHYLPANFGVMLNLERLDCRDNCIRRLPASFAELTKLEWLDLSHNPLVLTLAELNDNDGENWSPERCEKAAVAVTRMIGRLNLIRAQEKEDGTLYGAELRPQTPPVLSSQSCEEVPRIKHRSRVESEKKTKLEFQVQGPYSKANGPKMDDPTPKFPGPKSKFKLWRSSEPRNPEPEEYATMTRASFENLLLEDESDWKDQILPGMCLIARGLAYLGLLSFLLACFVDQSRLDQLAEYAGLPIPLFNRFSSWQHRLQLVTSKLSPFFPIVKSAEQNGFLIRILNFFGDIFNGVLDFFTGPQTNY